MNDKLLNEISRFRKLSGLSLINEQGGSIDNLLSLSGKRIKNLDDFIDALNLTGKNLTDDQIGSLVDEMVDAGAMLPNSGKLLKQELKANAKLRYALSNRSEDFVSAVKNAGKKENLVGLWGVNILNKSQVLVVYTKLVKQFLDVAGSNTQSMFNSIDNEFASYLQQIYDSGIGLHSIDEVWDVIDGNILEHVNTSGFSPELAEAHFKEFSKKIKEGSKTKEILDKINAEGRNAGKPKRTTPVTEYKPDYKVPEEWAGTPKKLIHRDEAGKAIKYSDSTPIKVDGDNLPAKVDDGGSTDVAVRDITDDIEDVFDEYEYVNDPPITGNPPRRDPFPNGVPERAWYRNFFYKFCRMNFCEVLYELAVSLMKTPEQFANDMIITQQRIIDLTRRLDEIPIENVKERLKLTRELNSEIQRLKSNTKMMTTNESGFIQQWDIVKRQIRETLADYPDWANRVIDYIENNEVAGGSINKFIEDMKAYYDGAPTQLWDVRYVFTPEYWKEWAKTSFAKYKTKIGKEYAEGKKGNAGWVGGVSKALITLVGDFLKTLFEKLLQFGFVGYLRSYKAIINKLRFGPYRSTARIKLFERWGIPEYAYLDSGLTIPGTAIRLRLQSGIARWLSLYVQIMLISNVLEPLWNFIVNLRDSFKEIKGKKETGSKDSPFEELFKDIVEQFNIFGSKFEWVPFFDPVGPLVGSPIGERLGLKPAPLSEFINETVRPWVKAAFSDTEEDISQEILAKKQAEFDATTKELIETINDQENELYKQNPKLYPKSTPEESIIETIYDYSEPNIQQISYADTTKLEKALVFIPELSPRMQNKLYKDESSKTRKVKNVKGEIVGSYNPKLTDNNNFVPNQYGISQGYSTSTDIPENTEIDKTTEEEIRQSAKSNSGYWALKSKDGKLYEIFQDQDGWIYFISPDTATLKQSPRTKITENELPKFVPYLP